MWSHHSNYNSVERNKQQQRIKYNDKKHNECGQLSESDILLTRKWTWIFRFSAARGEPTGGVSGGNNVSEYHSFEGIVPTTTAARWLWWWRRPGPRIPSSVGHRAPLSGGISLQLKTSTQAARTFVTGVTQTQTETILGEDIHLHLHLHHRCPGGRGHIKDEHQEVETVETIIWVAVGGTCRLQIVLQSNCIPSLTDVCQWLMMTDTVQPECSHQAIWPSGPPLYRQRYYRWK